MKRAVADEAQALLTVGEEVTSHSPTPPRMTCAANWTTGDSTLHICGLSEHDGKVRHACKDCPAVYAPDAPHTPHSPIAHSRQITDRLLNHDATPLSPEPGVYQQLEVLTPTVVGTVTRDPASEAIATAARRLVHRTGQQIAEFNEEAWRNKKTALHSRIATRLEDAGLSPATVLKFADVLVADVLAAAADVDSVLREEVDQVMKADVARNLLPKIGKVMKETNNG